MQGFTHTAAEVLQEALTLAADVASAVTTTATSRDATGVLMACHAPCSFLPSPLPRQPSLCSSW